MSINNLSNPPIISVILPVGGIDQYLEETLISIKSQTFQDFELLIACEHSIEDKLKQLLFRFNLHSQSRILTTSMQGLAFVLNLAISVAKGEFIARWDADDLCDSVRLAKQIEEFRLKPELSVLGTRGILIDCEGKPISFHKFKFYESNNEIRKALRYRQPLLHTSIMIRKSLLIEKDGYLFGYSSEDHALYIRIARDKQIKFANLSDVCSYYRRHPHQLSDSQRQYQQFCDIAGFMVIEFLRTGHPMYLIGVAANHPILRSTRKMIRGLFKFLFMKS